MFFIKTTSKRELQKIEKYLQTNGLKSTGSQDSIKKWANQFSKIEIVIYQTKENEYTAMSIELFKPEQFQSFTELHSINELKNYLKGG